MKEVTVDELKSMMDNNEDFKLIDIREEYEYDIVNIGGELIPIGGFMAAIPEMEHDKSGEIVVYCRSGNRSGMAQALMQAQGFSNVRNLVGGMLSWRENFG